MARADLRLRAVRALFLLPLMALGACQEYLVRSVGLTPSSGDAVAANEAIATIDPWPRRAFDQHIVTQGYRLDAPMEQYRAGEPIGKGAARPAPMVFAPVATAQQ